MKTEIELPDKLSYEELDKIVGIWNRSDCKCFFQTIHTITSAFFLP